MNHWIARNSLYFKISALLFTILGILGVAYVLISGYTTRKYLDEFQQRLYGGLADSTVAVVKPLINGRVDTMAIKDIMHSIMVINPSAEVYLLDTTGKIITYMAPHKKIKLDRVDLGPVRQYISEDRPRIVKGDDPRHPNTSKIFSAAVITGDGKAHGYLYMILASEEQQAVAASLYNSYFYRMGVQVFFISLAIALALGLFAIWYLTQKLRKVNATVRRFKEGDLQARIEDTEGDWKTLAETFNEMADTINENIETLRSVESLRRDLIANVSHDLRTPLAIMKGYIETLQIKQHDLTDEERARYLDIAHNSAEKLSRLVSQLFEYSKLEGDQVQPEKEPFQISDLVMDTIQKYELMAADKNIDLKLNAPGKLPLVFADLSLVERVVQNLMDNALQYTPDGGKVEIKLSDLGDGVEVCIADTGPGIPEADQAYIFDRYRKASAATTNGNGTGLGLAIVKKIMELHDAKIRIQSKLHEGTSFMFVLPAYPV